MIHYRVILEEAYEPKGISCTAIRKCMCCGTSISVMGGGGDYLCLSCLDKMRTGKMSEILLKTSGESFREYNL